MSLDLDGKMGRAHNTSPIDGTPGAGAFPAVDVSTFDSGDAAGASSWMLQVQVNGNVDISAGSPDALSAIWPDPFTGAANILEDGMRITVIKVGVKPGTIQFKDPVTGVFYSFVDKQGEGITLVYDTAVGAGAERWIAEI